MIRTRSVIRPRARSPRTPPAPPRSLAALIRQTGLSPAYVARRCGLAPNSLYSWMRGGVRPWPSTGERLARYLDITFEELVRLTRTRLTRDPITGRR